VTNRNLRSRLDKVRAKASSTPDEGERIERALTKRIWFAIIDELSNTTAAGGKWGGPDIRSRPEVKSICEQTFGPAWTYRQWHQLVVDRVFTPERLDKALGTGETGTNEDLRPYFDIENEDLESLKELWFEALRIRDGQTDTELDDVNRWHREEQEKAEQERQQAIRQEWNL
jgi:hypothetical protein